MNRYFTFLFPVIFLLFLNNSFPDQGGHHSYSRSYHSTRSYSHSYHSPKISSHRYYSPGKSSGSIHSSIHKPTYKSGSTTYIAGEHYKNGLPKVERSTTAKKEFLREHGYKKVPAGYEVDHIQPLQYAAIIQTAAQTKNCLWKKKVISI